MDRVKGGMGKKKAGEKKYITKLENKTRALVRNERKISRVRAAGKNRANFSTERNREIESLKK